MPLSPEQLTLLGVFVTLGVLGRAKVWVFGWVYADKEKQLGEMTTDRNFWRDTALRSMGHVDQALGGKG